MPLSSKQNSLRFKIGIGFGSTALILITALIISLYQINQIRHNLYRVMEIELPLSQLSHEMNESLSQSQIQTNTWVQTRQPNSLTQRNHLWQTSILPALDKMKNVVAKTGYTDLALSGLDEQILDFKKQQESLLGHPQNTLSPSSPPTVNSVLHSSLLHYQYTHEEQSKVALQQIKEALITIFFLCAGFLLLGIILCILMAVILTHSITHPIRELLAATQRLAIGNLRENVTIQGAVEFEILSESLNQVIFTLRTIATVTEKMAMGDYSQRLEVRSQDDVLATSLNQMLDNFSQIVSQANSIAEGHYSTHISPRSSMDKLGTALQNMTQTLKDNQQFWLTQNWLKDGLTNFANIVSENRDLPTLCGQIIAEIARYTEAGCGTLYLFDEADNSLKLYGSFAFVERPSLHANFKLGEGIIGQVGLEKKPLLLSKTEEIIIITGTQELIPETLYAMPILYEKNLVAVIELAWHHPIKDILIQYLKNLEPMLASHIKAAFQQEMTATLLKAQQSLTDKLKNQQEALSIRNQELAEQTKVLQASEENLRHKEEFQQAINKKLEEKTTELQMQKEVVEQANLALEKASTELKAKAHQLSLASQYKSEFLANMSHELRTPLNSLIILAKLLSENRDDNLNADQIESAKIMLKSGQDLLTLINDILDLAKVEAGKIEIHLNPARVIDFINNTVIHFKHVAEEKHIDLHTELSSKVPDEIVTDEQRVFQIIRNLISNAIKFTPKGQVCLLIEPAKIEEIPAKSLYKEYLAFRVIDSGIGIPLDKQQLVFEAFQQVDGTTSRQFGGTGLGLSISTEFAKLLHGNLTVKSEPDKGSTFSLIIPNQHDNFVPNAQSLPVAPSSSAPIPTLLILSEEIEQSELFAALLTPEYRILSTDSTTTCLAQLKKETIQGLIIDADYKKSDIFKFINEIKGSPESNKLPVLVLGSLEENKIAISRSAFTYLKKPLNAENLRNAMQNIEVTLAKSIQTILIIEDDLNQLNAIKKLLMSDKVLIETAATGTEALYKIMHTPIDCIILDLGLPDISGQEIINRYKESGRDRYPAIIIYTGRDLSQADSESLKSHVDAIIFKGHMASMDKLKAETCTFLKQVRHLSHIEIKNPLLKPMIKTEDKPFFSQENVLLVDDDMRNVYALSQVLKECNLRITIATEGQEALEKLKENKDIALIFMDIMMPIMDGYRTTHLIRQTPYGQTLPIIALSAKVMTEDRQKAIEAGANDFLSKPINLDQLYSMLNKWLTPKD